MVDVWITTYNESLDILRRTIYHCVKMDYPHETYVLDDGNRPEVRELAYSLGARYISRERNTHAKAGNMNNALKYTNGAFIAIFDADFIPQRNFLTELLGYFNDPSVALVQTPQQYYNLNSFQHRPKGFGKELWNEQITFFELVLCGRNYWNAASWIGTNAILRRTAVESAGGFAIESVTEDMLTSMRIHAKGWRSIYVRKYLAFGLAPSNLPQFLTQRLRWSQGLAQILRNFNPFLMKGLTLPQRFFYFSSIMHFFEGSAKFVYYLMPSLFFLTGIVPVRLGIGVLAVIMIHPFFNIGAIKLLAKGKTSIFNHETFAMARFFSYFLGNFMALSRKKIRFKVTPKQDSGSFSFFYALGPGCVLGINLAFFLTIFYPLVKSGVGNLGVYFCIFLCGYFVVIAFAALLLCFSAPKQGSFNIYDTVPLKIHNSTRSLGKVSDLPFEEKNITSFWSDTSIGFISETDFPLGRQITCELHPNPNTDPLWLEARITGKFLLRKPRAHGRASFHCCAQMRGNLYEYRADFGQMEEQTRLELVDQAFYPGVYRQHLQYEEVAAGAELSGGYPLRPGRPERKINLRSLATFMGVLILGVFLGVYVAPYRFYAQNWLEENLLYPRPKNAMPSSTVVRRYGNLQVIGTQLCDQGGNPVQLKGISSHGLQWFPFTNNRTVKNCVRCFGIDVIRIAMYTDYSNQGEYSNGYLAQPVYMTTQVDKIVQDAVDEGIYVIISWHMRGDPTRLTADARKFFRRMATRWGGSPNVIFEICNEPAGEIPWSKIRSYAVGNPQNDEDGVIDVIRKYDPDGIPNLVLVGTPLWCQGPDRALEAPVTEYKNIMYTFHFYVGTHKEEIQKNVQRAIAGGLPVFVSEWGTSRADGDGPLNLPRVDAWVNWMNQNQLSWVNWSLSNKGESSSILKLGVSMAGPWTDKELSTSGKYLKRKLVENDH
jgi:cellulose synthase/poly-beta-1,6-N-acetylglucosamine synthase-like glycosyltransferase/aryl-phospho-beta-D-glucosidase BglC (GH1 family)